ncbi:hypothetical protein [Aureimonas sp. Leaf324]|uniref:hypothetical protein n=1 Tax=Aureimonas sp. Leaf324 TaxID=1736336 RepID=UPI0006F84CED|nr:hypothetical protein [Aureimonas sp. Leaf324]KQQ81932.1 hypothetical protein ASF65_07710 [Aureimonas sp. Leaf324]
MRSIRTGLRNPVMRSGDRLGANRLLPAKHWFWTNQQSQSVGQNVESVTATWQAPADGLVDVTAIAPGGGGNGASNVANQRGGASGAVGRTTGLEVRKGQQIQISVGPRGGGSTTTPREGGNVSATFPNGDVAVARGGPAGSRDTTPAAPTATGFKEAYAGLVTGVTGGGTSPILGQNLTVLEIVAQPNDGSGESGRGFGNGGNSRGVTDQAGGSGAPGALTIDFYAYE